MPGFTWLSMTVSLPVPSLASPPRSQASTVSGPLEKASATRGRSSWGRVKSTAMGSIWVSTTMPFASVGVTRFPTSTWRTPAMPSMGEVTLENWRLSRALFTAAWSRATVARAESTVASCRSYCCCEMSFWEGSSL